MIELDRDLYLVLEFMERNVDTGKLVRVAEGISSLAPVLWAGMGASDFNRLAILRPESNRGQQSTAKGSLPEQYCAHGDSVGAMDTP
jgi:hypothetical protein